MALHQILPAATRYASDLAEGAARKAKIGAPATAEISLAKRLGECCDRLYENTEKLAAGLRAAPKGSREAADHYSDIIVPCMVEVRRDADLLEKLTAKSYWPYPTYSDILFY